MKNTVGYVLCDPRPIAVEAPYTFFLPMQSELESIVKGDLVKLIFEPLPEDTQCSAERMWVSVSAVTSDRLTGNLCNEPTELPLRYGDEVSFHRHQIISIESDNQAHAPAENINRREYWDRCLVDDCVLNGSEPVEYIYREEPDMAKEGDHHPDSGWRIRGRQGNATSKDMDERELKYVALGTVLNKDNSWLHLVDAPIGSAFIRDFETDKYLVQKN